MAIHLKRTLTLLLVCALLTVPAMAAGGGRSIRGDYSAALLPDVAMPTSALTQLQMELFVLGGIGSSIDIVSGSGDLQTQAESFLSDFYENDPDFIVLYYRTADGAVGIAYGENVAAVLTDEDADAIRAAFSVPDAGDPYACILNGMKQLDLCVFDGGDYDVPDFSYTAQFLREPDAVPVSAGLPKDIITPGYAELDERRLIELRYLVDEIDYFAGISTGVVFLPTAESGCETMAGDTLNVLAHNSEYPAVVMAFADDTDAVAVRISETMGDILPADAAERLAAAISGAEGDGYDRAMAGLKELASILFADGAREYDENSGIALALDPDAFEESAAFPVAAVAGITAVVVIAVGVLLVILRRKRRRKG